ncbi:metal ABC transporter permease [Pelomicrobium methylotrophicum]|uniref:ABC transporter n=1 Tax=Pelomicrobium methylotrophicum TaxID=2602750 RepID=A0A5C7F1Z3_9PROT|nr:metal ABC transporter permease [Pelomicrobium methylotrophicum]TXF13798.1 ABC transporter [Pelomicrobium methylotrophicum]
MDALFDPLFQLPFATGFAYALCLPALGMYLQLREEWIAALALAQVSAFGALAAAALNASVMMGAAAATLAAAAAKGHLARRGATGWILLLLFGWSGALLLAANLPLAEPLGRALLDGQLYFTGAVHLGVGVAAAAVAFGALAKLSRPLLLERLLPGFLEASGAPVRRLRLAFDLLAAVVIALATASIGVMATFALLYTPSVMAYRFAPNWRTGLFGAVLSGAALYVVGFSLALALDQPFGPVLVGAAVAVTALSMSGSVRAARGR